MPTLAYSAGELRAGWWILRASAIALSLLSGVGCAATDSSDEVMTDVSLESEPRIFGGATDDDPTSTTAVVALKVGSNGTYELCSGALIAPNVVLTARHCVTNSITTRVSCDEKGKSTNGQHVAGEQAPEAIAVYTGASPKFSSKPNAIGKEIIAPQGDSLCDTDIALIVLDAPITNVEPLPVRLSTGVRIGETIRSVGYGQNDKLMPLGTRLRKAGVSVLAMGSGVSQSQTALGPHEFEVGRSICQGDSGGPAISETSGAIVGVVSRGGDCNNDFGHIYTTTAGWAPLFDAAFKRAGGAPSVEVGEPTIDLTPRTVPIRSPLADQPTRGESCTSSGAPVKNGSASLALLLACGIVLRARRKRAAST